MRKLLRWCSRPWLAIVLFLAALGIALLRVIGLSHGFGIRLSANWAMVDFQAAVYYPLRSCCICRSDCCLSAQRSSGTSP